MITIGMPCYNDYDGAYFTVQSLRLHHDLDDCQILIVDTKGDDRLKKFAENTGVKYDLYPEPHGTAPAKNRVFEAADGDYVLCIDSHILFKPGSIDVLKAFIKNNPNFDGLGYGVLVYDDLKNHVDRMEPVWRGHMWGIWGKNLSEADLPKEPVDIWGHGGGIFFANKKKWLGFHKEFRGFGGEEGYLPEKYRKHSRRVVCVPGLKWIHRFGAGTGYRLQIEDRIRNSVLGYRELGLDLSPIYEHFGKKAVEKVASNLTEKEIIIKSFNGIGDLLYATPSFPVLKKTGAKIHVNTNYPGLLENNPHVDSTGGGNEGIFLSYPDIIHRKLPTQHHILSDWECVCKGAGVKTEPPKLRPEIHFDLPKRTGGLIVQTISKNTFSGKKIWPHAEKFAEMYGFTPIPHFDDIKELVRFIAKAQLVVCMEGAVHHIAAAVETPAIVVLGGLHRCNWIGYDDQKYIEIDCPIRNDCYNPKPCKHQNKMYCMHSISPEYVYKEALSFCRTPIRLYPEKKKLNLGSGEMLLKDHINFDAQIFKRHGIFTDTLGFVEKLTDIYEENTFDEVLSAHVIEHQLEPDSIKMLKDIHKVLKPGGKAIIEGPDFLGAQKVAGENVQQAIRWIMSHTVHPKKWGDHWYHKSAWTKDIVAEAMEKVGYQIVHKGIGLTHGMGERDFRVEGVKC